MLPSFIFSSLNIANRKTNIVTLTRIKFSFIFGSILMLVCFRSLLVLLYLHNRKLRSKEMPPYGKSISLANEKKKSKSPS